MKYLCWRLYQDTTTTLMINTLQRFCFSILLLLCTIHGSAQVSQSFEDYIKGYDKKEIPEVAVKYSHKNIYKDPDAKSAVAKCDAIILYAQQTDSPKLLCVAKRIKGTYLSTVKRDFQEAHIHLEESLEIARKHKFPIEEARSQHQLGLAYYLNNDMPNCLKNILYADQLMQNIGYQNIPGVSRPLYTLALVLSDLYSAEKSNHYLNMAIQYGTDNEAIMAAYNQLGTSYKKQEIYDTALVYCKKSLEYAKKLNDSLRIGIICGNIGEIYLKMDSVAQGIAFLNTAEQISSKYNDYEHSFTSSMLLAEHDMKSKQYDSVRTRLDKADLHIQQHGFTRKEHINEMYYKLRSEIYKMDGEYALAVAAMDSIIKLKNNSNATEVANTLRNIETSILVEKFNAEIAMSEAVRKKQKVLFIGGILIAVLVIIVLYLTYTKQLERRKQNLRILELRQKNVEDELQHSKNRLQDFVQSLKEKNALIDELKMELDEINTNNLLSDTEKEEVVQKMRNATILTEKDWNDFKVTFEKVHSNFFNNVLSKYPSVTVSELRILSLLKLNLSADEMATMLGVSPDSVKRTFRRIRAKIDLPNQFSLEKIVHNIR